MSVGRSVGRSVLSSRDGSQLTLSSLPALTAVPFQLLNHFFRLQVPDVDGVVFRA